MSKWSSWHKIFRKNVLKVNQGKKNEKKRQKGQISNLIERSQIVRQNEALDLRFSIKFMSRSFKVIQGLNRRKRSNFEFYQKY